MKLLYFRSAEGNFGDDLNGWLWPRLFPDRFDDDDSELFVGIGTILDGRIPAAARRKIVFGSGVRSPATAPTLDASWDLRFVRGPLSALALGLERDSWISDGAVCLRLLDAPKPIETGRPLLVPHYHTLRDHSYLLSTPLEGVDLLDPREPPETAIARIRGASEVIAESLHAAIVADLFRVPWTRIKLHSWRTETAEVAAFKWLDWGFSMSVDVDPAPGPGLARGARRLAGLAAPLYRRLARERLLATVAGCREASRFQLSGDSLLEERIGRAAAAVDSLRGDLRA